MVKTLSQLIGNYKLYSDANQVKKLTDTLAKTFEKCKGTLKEALQMEDYEDEGAINVASFKEAFDSLEIELDKEVMDFLIWAVYQRSESLEKMNYQVLLDLVDGKVVQGGLSVGSAEGGARKRPESSSPEKLKARNKEKYNGAQSQNTQQSNKGGKGTKGAKGKSNGDEDDDDNYDEEFEGLLD